MPQGTLSFVKFAAALFAAVCAVDAVWIAVAGVEFDGDCLLTGLALFITTAAISAALWLSRQTRTLARISLYFAVLFAFPDPLMILGELIIRIGRPMIDPALAAWDARLGFDWVGYMHLITDHPTLLAALHQLYNSIAIQSASLVIILGLLERFDIVERMVINLIISATIVAICGGLVPAVGAYEYFGLHDPTGIAPFIRMMHDGGSLSTKLTDYRGTVAFPSYHAAIAVAYILAAWPVRYLRYPVLAVNLAMIAGIPVHGAHYLVDLIAGAAMTAAVDLSVRALRLKPARSAIVVAAVESPAA